MTLPRTLKTLLAAVLFALAAVAFADHESMMGGYGYGPAMPGMQMPGAMMPGGGYDPMAQMEMLQRQADLAYQQSVQNYNAAVVQERRLYIDYYRQNTGDTATPDDQAYTLGYQLYCSRNPVDCQTMAQQNRQWAAQSRAQHQTNMAQLDANHNAWMAGQAASEQSTRDFIQGVIWEESTWVNPQTGQGWSLPNSPQPGTSFNNGMTFNPATGGWSQNGVPLVPGN